MASAGLLLSSLALADEPPFQTSKPSKPAEAPPFVERPSEPEPSSPSPAATPEVSASPAPRPSPIATAPAPPPAVVAPDIRPLGVAPEPSSPAVRPKSAPPPRATQKRAAAAPKAAPKRVKKPKRKKGDRASLGPVATYPAFRMMDGGSSRIFVGISRKVDVSEHKAQGRLVYRMQGAEVLSRTNQLPLDTSFFATPVGRVRLVQQGSDVDLVIDLREAVDVQHRIEETRDGVVLVVDFPPSRVATAKPEPTSTQTEPVRAARARPATETTRIGSGSGPGF